MDIKREVGMGDRAKGPFILLVILLVIAAAAAFLGFIALQKEKEINTTLTEKNEELDVKALRGKTGCGFKETGGGPKSGNRPAKGQAPGL